MWRLRRTVRRDDRDPVQPRPPRGDQLDPRDRTPAPHRGRGPVRSGRLLTLRTRGSAAYKGIYALLLKEGAIDWRTGEAGDMNLYFDEAVDIHHIFPKIWCEKQGIEPSIYDSIVNKTPLTARTDG